ncbi:serine/threonine-protein phosphatase CPPED1 isoform X3 [Aquarana catesbeiana]|uniref:serine/threonine-protein phosphatase CPPED1 isoform X3 n=1 Tax=Aquarana catesbeiana TaxID=8400 RepID=UPI003CC9A040
MKSWAMDNCDFGGDEWDDEVRLTEKAVEAINNLEPKPKFFVLCGDLVHSMPATEWKPAQECDLKTALLKTNHDIPLVFVSGNHDLGNAPTSETIQDFSKNWGDDYFSFWNPDEENTYFNLERSLRQELLEKFHKADVKSAPLSSLMTFKVNNSPPSSLYGPRVKAVFSGHYHRNAGGTYKDLDMVVTSAIGCQLGEDEHGVRVVVVTKNQIVHRYYSLDKLKNHGLDQDIMDLIKKY